MHSCCTLSKIYNKKYNLYNICIIIFLYVKIIDRNLKENNANAEFNIFFA